MCKPHKVQTKYSNPYQIRAPVNRARRAGRIHILTYCAAWHVRDSLMTVEGVGEIDKHLESVPLSLTSYRVSAVSGFHFFVPMMGYTCTSLSLCSIHLFPDFTSLQHTRREQFNDSAWCQEGSIRQNPLSSRIETIQWSDFTHLTWHADVNQDSCSECLVCVSTYLTSYSHSLG